MEVHYLWRWAIGFKRVIPSRANWWASWMLIEDTWELISALRKMTFRQLLAREFFLASIVRYQHNFSHISRELIIFFSALFLFFWYYFIFRFFSCSFFLFGSCTKCHNHEWKIGSRTGAFTRRDWVHNWGIAPTRKLLD